MSTSRHLLVSNSWQSMITMELQDQENTLRALHTGTIRNFTWTTTIWCAELLQSCHSPVSLLDILVCSNH